MDAEIRREVFRDDRPIPPESPVGRDTPADRHINAPTGSIHIPAAGKSLREIEREAVALTMSLTRHNQSAAARILGISRPTLLRKLREHALRIENARRIDSAPSAQRSSGRPAFVRRASPGPGLD